MRKMLNERNQIHNFKGTGTVSVRTFVIPFYYGSGSGFGSGTVVIYGFSSDFFARYGSGSASQKVTVVPVPVPQRCLGQ